MTFSFTAARPSVFVSIAAAALLALTSCSGASTPDASAPGTSTSGASAQEKPAASSEQSAAAAPAPETTESKPESAKDYTEAQLTAILEGLKDADGKPLTLIPAAQLKQGQELTKTTLAGVTITPEACKAFANSNAELPEGSVYAAGSWMGDAAAGEMTAVTLLSAKPQLLSATFDRADKNSGACSTFTMEVGGQSVKTTMKPVNVDTSANVEKGTLISQDMPTGTTTNTVTVEALQGGLLVSVVQTGSDGSEGAAKKLAAVVDQVIAAS